MAVKVIETDEFHGWFSELDEADARAVTQYVGLLRVRGVTLGYPYSSALKGTPLALRELRPQSRGNPLRVIYAFDPERQAVLLLGADKTGMSDERFYSTHIPRAEKLWREYLLS
jgi:hypothetical protein